MHEYILTLKRGEINAITRQKDNDLSKVDENRIKRCFGGNIVQD